MIVPANLTPRSAKLIAEIQAEVGSSAGSGLEGDIGHRVQNIVGKYLSYDDLLNSAHCQSTSASYCQNVLHIASDGSFSVVALVWLPGQYTPVHDHIAWCVVGTYRGAEEEIRYRITSVEGKDYLIPTAAAVTPQGIATLIIPPDDIHMVRNTAQSKTISIHVYGADIRTNHTSIRRCYDLPVLSPRSTALRLSRLP